MILSIDPGREKCGWALVSHQGELMSCGEVSRLDFPHWVSAFCGGEAFQERWFTYGRQIARPEVVLLGRGTASREVQGILAGAGLAPQLVDERHTTERGYRLYERIWPPRGLRKLIPAGLRRPPRAVDDMAAWAIALRWLEEKETKKIDE